MPKWCLAACAALVVLALTSCSTKSPPQQKERERKAAGVALFRIHCNKDMWTSVEGLVSMSRWSSGDIPAKVAPGTGGLVTVELSGPNLVKLLEKLDYFAHGGENNHDPVAIRMYDAVAPRVDTIGSASGAGDPVPEVTIDDRVGGAAGTPAATASPRRS